MFKDVQPKHQQKSSFNSATYSSKTSNEHVKKSPVEYEDIIIIITSPAISRKFSPIGRNIEIPQRHPLSERKPDHNFKSHGQHD